MDIIADSPLLSMKPGGNAMKETKVSWLIYTLLAALCAFSLGWLLGSGGGSRTATVELTAPSAPTGQTQAQADGTDAEAAQTLPAITEEHPLELNTATQAQLEQLPGIGPTLAEAILSYREQFGGFATKEQLMEVPGIGEKRYGAVEALISVEVQYESSGRG